MPYSNDLSDKQILRHLDSILVDGDKVLDVGPGAGKWGHHLNYNSYIDAVEVFKPYITKFKLDEIYDNVYNDNIVCFNDIKDYDVVIMGDVLEHLSIEDAQKVVKEITSKCKEIIVVVPYTFKQGVEYDNEHEVHIQDDLTEKLMAERYPELKLMGIAKVANGIGWYVKKC